MSLLLLSLVTPVNVYAKEDLFQHCQGDADEYFSGSHFLSQKIAAHTILSDSEKQITGSTVTKQGNGEGEDLLAYAGALELYAHSLIAIGKFRNAFVIIDEAQAIRNGQPIDALIKQELISTRHDQITEPVKLRRLEHNIVSFRTPSSLWRTRSGCLDQSEGTVVASEEITYFNSSTGQEMSILSLKPKQDIMPTFAARVYYDFGKILPSFPKIDKVLVWGNTKNCSLSMPYYIGEKTLGNGIIVQVFVACAELPNVNKTFVVYGFQPRQETFDLQSALELIANIKTLR